MINVDLLSVIRRWHGRDKLSIREIAGRTGLFRNTIRKYPANSEVQPKYPQLLLRVDPVDVLTMLQQALVTQHCLQYGMTVVRSSARPVPSIADAIHHGTLA